MNDGTLMYVLLHHVMKDDEKFSQLLQNVVNFYDVNTKKNERAKRRTPI